MNWLNITKFFMLSIIPLFIAIGAIDAVPFVLSLTKGMPNAVRKKVVLEGTTVAGIILLVFLFVGKGILVLLEVSVSDFMVAGGLLLFILSARSLLLSADDEKSVARYSDVGIVPLATPLIAGPAAMATTLILLDNYGIFTALFSVIVNCFLAWLILDEAHRINRLLGERGTKAIGKVSYVVLASLGVMMVRKGIMSFLIM